MLVNSRSTLRVRSVCFPPIFLCVNIQRIHAHHIVACVTKAEQNCNTVGRKSDTDLKPLFPLLQNTLQLMQMSSFAWILVSSNRDQRNKRHCTFCPLSLSPWWMVISSCNFHWGIGAAAKPDVPRQPRKQRRKACGPASAGAGSWCLANQDGSRAKQEVYLVSTYCKLAFVEIVEVILRETSLAILLPAAVSEARETSQKNVTSNQVSSLRSEFHIINRWLRWKQADII